jgi:hypothetical protein
MKVAIFILLFISQLFAAKEYFYETGTSFLILKFNSLDKTLTLIPKPDAAIKPDGSYCYRKDEKCIDYPKSKDEDVVILNPVKYQKMAYPFERHLSPFEIPKGLSDAHKSFIDLHAVISNKTIEIKKQYDFLGHSIEVVADGDVKCHYLSRQLFESLSSNL